MQTQTPEAVSKPLLTRKEAADYLNANGFPGTAKTLQKLASVGGGPEYQIFGNKALYQPPKLLEWAQARLSTPRRHSGQLS